MSDVWYELKVEFYGLPAYVIDRLLETGLYGNTREGVVERLVANAIAEMMHADGLEHLGVTIQDARVKGYIPIKVQEPVPEPVPSKKKIVKDKSKL